MDYVLSPFSHTQELQLPISSYCFESYIIYTEFTY